MISFREALIPDFEAEVLQEIEKGRKTEFILVSQFEILNY